MVTTPAAPAHDPHAAMWRVFGCSWPQAGASAVLLAAIVALAWHWQAYAWLGLFGIVLLPVLLSAAILMGGAQLLREYLGWRSAWIMLLVSLALGAVLARGLYLRWTGAFGLPALGDLQALSAALGFGLLVLALPLSHAQRQGRALHLADLRQAALAAELKALQAQVEPHFLYNTLANARYLARHDPDKAVDMLDHLIAYLHVALPDMRADSSSAGRECALAGHYLALMAIRFGDRLSYEIDCPGELAGAALPPLMLLSLVENAVQHGLEPQPGAVHISVRAEAEGGALRVTVSDDGAGLQSGVVLGSGVGLRNLRERLAALFGAAAQFSLERSAAGRTEAALRLPLTMKA